MVVCNHQPIQNIPVNRSATHNNRIVRSISLSLKKHGFKFVGSTIVYAHMQATNMVNDHLVTVFGTRGKEVRTNKSRIPPLELILHPC